MKMTPTMKYLTTFALCFCYFAYGVNFYVVGPTLIELADLFQTTIERICLLYTIRSAGYTMGSLGGFLFNFVNRQLAFVFFVVLMGVTLILMPHCTSLMQVFTLAGINGFSIGSFDTAINVWILEMWQEESGPYMQALHFTYGLGSFVAPLVCEPFLSVLDSMNFYIDADNITDNDIQNDSIVMHFGELSTLNQTKDLLEKELEVEEFVVFIPYAIAGATTILSGLIVLGLYFYKKYEPPARKGFSASAEHEKLNKKSSDLGVKVQQARKWPSLFVVWLVVLGSLFLTFFVGMEQMHLQFLPTFAVSSDLKLSASQSALVSSAAAAAFTVGRGLSVPLAIKLPPQKILYSNHVLMFTGSLILLLYSNTSEVMMWLGNIILGAGFSSVYASIYAFLEQHLSVTNTIGSIFVFAGGLTAATSPSVVGHYIEAQPLILVYFNLGCTILCFFIFLIIHLSISLKNHKMRQASLKDTKSIGI